MGMRFPEYLKARFQSQREAADFFQVSPGLISHWMTGRRKPSPRKANEIIERTAGEVTFDQIYKEDRQ